MEERAVAQRHRKGAEQAAGVGLRLSRASGRHCANSAASGRSVTLDIEARRDLAWPVIGSRNSHDREAAGPVASTVSREIARNGGSARYRATTADKRAWDQGRRPKSCRLSELPSLQRIVATKLSQDWSPEQIAGWLRLNFADDERMQVSHETVYKSLFIQARGVLKKELMAHLRSRRGMRRSKLATTDGQVRGQIIDAVPSENDHQKSTTEQSPGIGRATCCAGQAIATSRRSLSKSLATSPMLRPPAWQSRTASALNSAVKTLRFRFAMEHSSRTLARFGVSTKLGQLHSR
ncbi:MAG: Integrase catalytic region [Myxococcaceae bacterium]|nr:Integrase catalytic region [Myxococcaceae bacterium]